MDGKNEFKKSYKYISIYSMYKKGHMDKLQLTRIVYLHTHKYICHDYTTYYYYI